MAMELIADFVLQYLAYIIMFGLVLHDGSNNMQPSCASDVPNRCSMSAQVRLLFKV
jgi:hypothetical protein